MGGTIPMGRRHSHGVGAIGLVFIFATLKWNCSNNVKCRILFLIYVAIPQLVLFFFFWERESANISWRQKQENWKEKWKWQSSEKVVCSSIITLIFGFFMTLGHHSGFRHVFGETGTTLQKGCFYVVVSQGN